MDESQSMRLEPGTSSASSSGVSNFAPSAHQQHDQLPDQLQTPPKKKRFCQFCRNHSIPEPTKGHKNECRFRFCKCIKCKNTRERHKVMAKQVAIKREKELAAYRKNQRSYENASSTPPENASSTPQSPVNNINNAPGAPNGINRLETLRPSLGRSSSRFASIQSAASKDETSNSQELWGRRSKRSGESGTRPSDGREPSNVADRGSVKFAADFDQHFKKVDHAATLLYQLRLFKPAFLQCANMYATDDTSKVTKSQATTLSYVQRTY